MDYDPTAFSGDAPKNYDDGMGPVIFTGYATDIAQRVASGYHPGCSKQLAAPASSRVPCATRWRKTPT